MGLVKDDMRVLGEDDAFLFQSHLGEDDRMIGHHDVGAQGEGPGPVQEATGPVRARRSRAFLGRR